MVLINELQTPVRRYTGIPRAPKLPNAQYLCLHVHNVFPCGSESLLLLCNWITWFPPPPLFLQCAPQRNHTSTRSLCLQLKSRSCCSEKKVGTDGQFITAFKLDSDWGIKCLEQKKCEGNLTKKKIVLEVKTVWKTFQGLIVTGRIEVEKCCGLKFQGERNFCGIMSFTILFSTKYMVNLITESFRSKSQIISNIRLHRSWQMIDKAAYKFCESNERFLIFDFFRSRFYFI